MVDIILIAAAVAVLVALIAVRRRPRNAPQPQVKTPASPAAPEPRQPGGRLAAALAAAPGRPPGAQFPGAPGAGGGAMAASSPSSPVGYSAPAAPFSGAQGGYPPAGAPSPAASAAGYPAMGASSPHTPAGSFSAIGAPSSVSPAGGGYPSLAAPSPVSAFPPGAPSPVAPAAGCSALTAAPPFAQPGEALSMAAQSPGAPASVHSSTAPPGEGVQTPASLSSAHAAASHSTPTTVLERTTGAFLEVVSGDDVGRRVPLVTGDNRIGRGPNNRLRLTDRTVSNQHAIVRMAPGQALLFDDSSTNGTYLNGQRVLQPRPLAPGDRITVGRTVLQFQMESEEAPLAG